MADLALRSMIGYAIGKQWVLRDHRYAWAQVSKFDLDSDLPGHTYDRALEVWFTDFVQPASTPRDGRAAELWLVEKKQAL